MCTYLAKRNATYYFRFPIPQRLRPAFDGKLEIMLSLRTKDCDQAKALIPGHTTAAHEQMRLAEKRMAELARGPQITSPRHAAAERAQWEYEQEADAHTRHEMAEQDARREARQELRKLFEARLLLSTQELEPWEAAIKDIVADKDFDAQLATDQATYYKYRLREAQKAGNPDLLMPAPPENAAAPVADANLDTTLVDRWAAERGVKPKGVATHRAVARWFYERVGKIPVAEISRAHVIAFKDKLLEEEQSPQNINMKLSRLKTLLGWAVDNDLATSNAAQGVGIKGAAAAPRKRLPFDLADLQAIFSSPIYAEGARPKSGKGEAAYWLPLLALFTGARLEEMGQLRPSDIQKLSYPDADGEEHSAWFLHITTLADEGEQANQLKNEESERLVPVHPELERLGFIAYADAMRKAGHARIFPLLTPGAYDRLTAKWGEWFGPYLRKVCKITDRRKVFHSFRHTFKHYAGHVGMIEGVQREIMGHSSGDVADEYRGGYSKHQLVEGMKVYRIAGLALPASA